MINTNIEKQQQQTTGLNQRLNNNIQLLLIGDLVLLSLRRFVSEIVFHARQTCKQQTNTLSKTELLRDNNTKHKLYVVV